MQKDLADFKKNEESAQGPVSKTFVPQTSSQSEEQKQETKHPLKIQVCAGVELLIWENFDKYKNSILNFQIVKSWLPVDSAEKVTQKISLNYKELLELPYAIAKAREFNLEFKQKGKRGN